MMPKEEAIECVELLKKAIEDDEVSISSSSTSWDTYNVKDYTVTVVFSSKKETKK